MGESVISESARSLMERAEPADIVLGVLTFNDHTTAPALIRSLRDGCERAFPSRRTLVVNCDGGSQDDTPRLIREALGPDARLWTIPHPVAGTFYTPASESGVPGREAAVRTLASLSDQLNAAVCLVVDGNMKSAATQWPQSLVDPILDKGVDCVLPWFRRNRYEGTLTNTLLAPLTSALYGKRIPYHLGGAYALSGTLIRSHLLSQPWDDQIARYGVDGWVTTLAVAEKITVCRAALGPRLQQAKPTGDLSTMVAQAVGCIFHLMERYETTWESVTESVAIPTIGTPVELGGEAGTIHVDRMADGFRQGLRDLIPIWQIVLADETFQQVLELGVEERGDFRFPASLWVQVVYDFALAYHDRALHLDHLLKAMTPLYLGYTASLIRETRAQSVGHVEQEFARLIDRFETMKPYLIQRWRWRNE